MHPAKVPSPRRPRLIRALVAAAAVLPVALGAAACGDDEKGSGKTEISIFWWGAESRATTTQKALDLYTSKHPDVVFKPTWQGNQGYFEKLATQAAGGNAPDIFQMDDNFLGEYSARGIAMDLSDLVASKKIDTSKFPESLAKYGQIDGKSFGIATGENTPAMVYDKTLLAQLKLPEPRTGMSWDELINWGAQVTAAAQKAGLKDVYGTMDPSADYKAFWMWLRQQKKDLYSGSQLGFTEADVTAWFELWKGAAAKKATPTADLIHAANGGDATKQLVVTKNAGTSFMWSNQMPDLAKNTDHELGVVAYPGDPSAQWARAALYWSAFKGTKHKDVVADVINFFVNDPEAAKILGTDRGLPSNTDLRKAIEPDLTAQMKVTVAFENEMTPKFGQAPPPPIKGHSGVRAALVKAAETVQYGKATPAEAAAAFVADAKAAIGG
ncbi:extracellular solute-binding protein [Luedemannella flava]|uniref:Extracellular solute-binding protein n=1 Tax=Luedemannella flava TaxID=349316 RepID=A0ABN2LLD9_9ACTN